MIFKQLRHAYMISFTIEYINIKYNLSRILGVLKYASFTCGRPIQQLYLQIQML